MALIAAPLNPFTLSDETATKLLEGLMNIPDFVHTPAGADEKRRIIARTLTDPANRAWLVWRGSELVGIFMLTDIAPKLDAVAHFAFFDRQLFGRKALIHNMIGAVFQEFGLTRITVELPEHLTPLIRFVRDKLGFMYEGEALAAEHPLMKKFGEYVKNPAQWAARLGARREKAFWRADTEEYIDLIRLRLLRSEYTNGKQTQSTSSC